MNLQKPKKLSFCVFNSHTRITLHAAELFLICIGDLEITRSFRFMDLLRT